MEMPHYRHRGVCIEGATSLENALAWWTGAAKRRMNTVFLQFITAATSITSGTSANTTPSTLDPADRSRGVAVR